jgi:hypothetical protein
MTLRITTLPAVEGWQWMRLAFALFRRKPWTLLLCAGIMFLASFIITRMHQMHTFTSSLGLQLVDLAVRGKLQQIVSIAFLGGLLVWFTRFFVITGLVSVFHDISQDKKPSLVFLDGHSTRRLVALGLYCLVFDIVAAAIFLFIIRWIGDAILPTSSWNDMRIRMIGLNLAQSILPSLFFLLISFSPCLIVWRKLTAAKAMLYSFKACLKNWRSLLTNGIFMTIVLVISLIPSTLLQKYPLQFLVFARRFFPLLPWFCAAFVMIALVILSANYYFCYKAIFGMDEDDL